MTARFAVGNISRRTDRRSWRWLYRPIHLEPIPRNSVQQLGRVAVLAALLCGSSLANSLQCCTTNGFGNAVLNGVSVEDGRAFYRGKAHEAGIHAPHITTFLHLVEHFPRGRDVAGVWFERFHLAIGRTFRSWTRGDPHNLLCDLSVKLFTYYIDPTQNLVPVQKRVLSRASGEYSFRRRI